MWIYLVSSIISMLVTNAFLSVLIPKFKQREEVGNTSATINKVVVPDKRLKVVFVCLSFFCVLISLILLLVPKICEMMNFDWLLVNIVWNFVLLIDLFMLLFFYQIVEIEYTEYYFLITNIFRKSKKINYSDIIKVCSNIKIFTKTGKYFIPASLFYGVNSFKNVILEKIRA